jgi:heat shock protein HspQ
MRTGETILNHRVTTMLGVTANNDNDYSNDEIRNSNLKKNCKRRV